MRFIKSNSFFDGNKFLSDNVVLVLNDNNSLKEIISENQIEKNKIEFFEGIIMPGFVNAHCHLELSHLKNKIPQRTGLLEFAKQIMSLRDNFGKEEITEAMLEADKAMYESGIVAVGDISNSTNSFETKSKSKIYYHTFVELIAFNPEFAQATFNKGLALLEELKNYKLAGSLAPHAPYSASTKLIKLIADMNLPFSIHNQETEEERYLFMGKKSRFKSKFPEFYKSLGMDISWFTPTETSSLKSYINVLSDTAPSLLVHNIIMGESDVEAAKNKNVFWCLCYAANLYIDGLIPDDFLVKMFKDRICIGTDSLASNSQLDVIYEANLLLENVNRFHSLPVVSVENILKALTSNGAAALGVEDKFGSFITGKNAGLNLVEIKDSELRFIKKIV